jgi:hypothetical protein
MSRRMPMLKVRAEAVVDALLTCSKHCDLGTATEQTADVLSLISWFLIDNQDRFGEQLQVVSDVALTLSFDEEGKPAADTKRLGRRLAAARRQMVYILDEEERA